MLPQLLLIATLFAADPRPDDDLTRQITALDAALFDAYNKCELTKFSALLSDDLEFYHDQTGLSVGRQSTVDAVKNNICGKVHRDLAPGTLAAYPLEGFGAVETGIHFFCEPKKAEANGGKCPNGSGVGRFTEIWQNKDGVWKITRVISYDHCNGCSTAVGPDYRVAPPKH